MLRLLCLFLLLGFAAPAAASHDRPVVRESLCTEQHGPTARRCLDAAPAADGWGWYRFGRPAAAAKLPADWQLLFSVTRFERVAVVIDHDGRQTVIERGSRELGEELAYGNHFRLTIPVPGRDIDGLRIGFKSHKDPELFRSVQAMSPAAHDQFRETWLMVLMITVTVVATSLIYNLFLYAGMGRGIRQWYVVWAIGALAYMLSWSGAAFHLVPGLVGEWGKRADLILIGLTVGAGTAFFFAFIEPGKLPPWLIKTGRALGLAVFVTGLLAAADTMLPAPLTDRLINIAFIASTASIMVGIGIAAARGSRSVWFYVVGWSPPIAVKVSRSR